MKKYFVEYERNKIKHIARFDKNDRLTYQCMIESCISSKNMKLIRFGTGIWND